MAHVVFVAILTALLAFVLFWGFRNLTRERWQFLAVVPLRKETGSQWSGLNLTTYGLINAAACVFGAVVLFVLLGAVAVPPPMIYALALGVLAVGIPASGSIARIVEKKAHTLTIGGASFAGLVTAPVIVALVNQVSAQVGARAMPVLPALAALSIAYSFGEGLGRLACISFGCCYGRRCSEVHPLLQALFRNRCFVFFGQTKKIAYESGLEGEPVVPIQAVTSIIYVAVGLAGLVAFLASCHLLAFVLVTTVTQVWRALSELLRSDYRGGGVVTAYQKLAILAVLFTFILVLTIPRSPTPPPVPDIWAGLVSIWDPGILLFFQALGVLMFTHMGRSRVTGSTLSFRVLRERV